jgi:hypothetical protein
MLTDLKTFKCNTVTYFKKDMIWAHDPEQYFFGKIGYKFEVEQTENCRSQISCSISDEEANYHIKLSLFCSHDTKTVYIMDAFGFDQGFDNLEYDITDIDNMQYYFFLEYFITQKVYENWILKVYDKDEFIVHQTSRRIIENVVNREKTDSLASLLPYEILTLIGKHMETDDIDRIDFIIEADVYTGDCDAVDEVWFTDYAMFEKCFAP